MLSNDLFKTIVEHTPLVAIDLIVRNKSGEILLGKRNNRPAQDYWFVPGGRILKDERFSEAFTRLTQTELGVPLNISEGVFLGPYEHHYQDNFSDTDFSTHYVVLAFEIELDTKVDQLPKLQHAEYQWFSEVELLKSDSVHSHTKWYFMQEKQLPSKESLINP